MIMKNIFGLMALFAFVVSVGCCDGNHRRSLRQSKYTSGQVLELVLTGESCMVTAIWTWSYQDKDHRKGEFTGNYNVRTEDLNELKVNEIELRVPVVESASELELEAVSPVVTGERKWDPATSTYR